MNEDEAVTDKAGSGCRVRLWILPVPRSLSDEKAVLKVSFQRSGNSFLNGLLRREASVTRPCAGGISDGCSPHENAFHVHRGRVDTGDCWTDPRDFKSL